MGGGTVPDPLGVAVVRMSLHSHGRVARVVPDGPQRQKQQFLRPHRSDGALSFVQRRCWTVHQPALSKQRMDGWMWDWVSLLTMAP